MRVRVAVPASVANLGPGFDILALALQLQNDIRAEQRTGALTIDAGPRRPDGAQRSGAQPRDASPTRSRARRSAFPSTGVHFTCVHRIPIGRGMGSSAAAALAGVLVAAALHQAPWDEDDVLDRVAELEGHRDNAAAALLGGSRHLRARMPLRPSWRSPTSSVRCSSSPTCRSRPTESRQVVPATFSRADAIFNASRCALLVRALALGDHASLRVAMQDRWHQDARFALMTGTREVVDAANACRRVRRRPRGGGSVGHRADTAGPGAHRRGDGGCGGERRRGRYDDGPRRAQLRHQGGRIAVTRVVQKYGGSSVATPMKLRRVARRIRESVDAGSRGRRCGERNGRHHR